MSVSDIINVVAAEAAHLSVAVVVQIRVQIRVTVLLIMTKGYRLATWRYCLVRGGE